MNEALAPSERPPPVSRPPRDDGDGDGAPPGIGAAGLAPLAEPPVAAVGWPRRAIDAVSAYLPLLLMALLALGSWWLVKNTPLFEKGRVGAPLRHEPDYTMTGFRLQRFAANGALRVQLEGDLMRHYPDTETIEIDNPRIRDIADDGRVTLATAHEALSNKDGSEVQLSGDAHIVRVATPTELAIDFRSEFLQYFEATEQVRTHLPVVITQGGTEIHADAMTYDNIERNAEFSGRIHAVLPPRPAQSRAPTLQRQISQGQARPPRASDPAPPR